MIEFKGYLTGAAEKRFNKRAAQFGQNCILASLTIFFPFIAGTAMKMGSWGVLIAYLSFYLIFPLLTRIPRSKKEQAAVLPKRIYTEGNSIVCVAEKYKERKKIADVKLVRDFGEFYELVFPFGKYSEKFICQKSLLSKGTLKAFEALFPGKIVRM